MAADSSKSSSPARQQLGRGWLASSGALAVVGAGFSLYSLWHHLELKQLGQTDAACNINASISCDAVAQSSYSELWSIPLGVWGLGFFLALAGLLALLAWPKARLKEQALLSAYGGLVFVGVAVSVVLASISFFVIEALCLSCLGIYLVNLALAGLAGARCQLLRRFFSWASLGQGAALALLPLLVVVGGYKLLGQQPSPASQPKENQPQSSALSFLASKSEDIPLALSPYAGLGEDYRAGSDQAQVVIHVFSDFQCPACQRMSEIMASLKREYGERLLVVYRHYPLDHKCNPVMRGRMHDFACKAAVLSRCAGQYGKFWAYHDKVFAEQAQISGSKLEDWAREVGLSDEQITTCLASNSILEKVKDDITLGNKLGVEATPTLYLNGRKVLRGGFENLRAEIEKILHP